MLLSPFVNVGYSGDAEGHDDSLNMVTYLVHGVLTSLAMFVLTLALLTGRYIMGFSDINVAERAIYLALLAAVVW